MEMTSYEMLFCFKQKTAYELRISDWRRVLFRSIGPDRRASRENDVRHHPVRILFIQADAFDLADLDAVELHFRADAQTPDRTVEADAIGIVGSSKPAAAEPDDENDHGYQQRGRDHAPKGIACMARPEERRGGKK